MQVACAGRQPQRLGFIGDLPYTVHTPAMTNAGRCATHEVGPGLLYDRTKCCGAGGC